MAVRELSSMREQLWVLAHDHRDLRPLIEVRALAVGLAAAVLTDLMLHRCIVIEDDRIYLEEDTKPAEDPITAGILAGLDVTPAPGLQDVLHAARPDLPEDPRNPFQRLHERTVAAMVAADILVVQRRAFRSARYELVDPSLASWTRVRFNRRLVYSDSTADDLDIDILCALTWALNLHHKLLMPFNGAEASPILLSITDRIPKRAGKRSALTVMPHLARTIRHTIGDLATAAF